MVDIRISLVASVAPSLVVANLRSSLRQTSEIKRNPPSQSFSQSYGSILPTSLTYFVPSTRGCTPWRPAAVISTTSRNSHSFPWIFTVRQVRSRHCHQCSALPSGTPLRQLTCFRGHHQLTRKEISSRGPCQCLQVHSRCRPLCEMFWNINQIPFWSPHPRAFTALACSLGSTNPSPTAVHLEPFPTSVFKVLF